MHGKNDLSELLVHVHPVLPVEQVAHDSDHAICLWSNRCHISSDRHLLPVTPWVRFGKVLTGFTRVRTTEHHGFVALRPFAT